MLRTMARLASLFASSLPAALAAALVIGTAAAQGASTTIGELSKRTHFHGLAVDPADSTRLLLATHHGLFTVQADGTARQVSSSTDDFMGFSPHPTDGVTLYSSGHPAGGGNLGFMVSTDGGQTWTRLSPGAKGTADFHSMTVSPADPKTIYGTYGGLQVSRDGGNSWQVVGPGAEETIDLAASARDANQVYAGTNSGLLLSRDGGKSWERAHSSETPVPLVAVGNDGTVYAFVLGTGLVRAREPDLAWETVGRGIEPAHALVHLAIDPKEPRRLYAVAFDLEDHGSALLTSADGGESWSEFGANP
jgi:photosystem II stability/assembly factor-like uncharacterized protein